VDDLLVDLHVDTITAMVENQWAWGDERLEASLPELVEAGVDVIVEAVWIPRNAEDPRAIALDRIGRIRRMVQTSRGRAALVTGPAQLEAAVREGRLAVVIALEGGTALTDGPTTLGELADLGLSMVGLTWSESSQFADSSAEPRSGEAGGLTANGREIVAACNDRGLMIDVSHMSDRATAETLSASRAPVLASHSNAWALAPTARNLRPELLTRIADAGGLVGVMFHGPFVVTDRPATRADVAAQVLHMVNALGAEHVGLGSDWDGKIFSPPDLAGVLDLPALVASLEDAGLDASAAREVSGRSFLRFWRAVRAASARGTDRVPLKPPE
jgi:membrane dipeptidase